MKSSGDIIECVVRVDRSGGRAAGRLFRGPGPPGAGSSRVALLAVGHHGRDRLVRALDLFALAFFPDCSTGSTQMCSRIYSDGKRRTQGVLWRNPYHSLSIRHLSDGNQVKPPSIKAIRSVGN